MLAAGKIDKMPTAEGPRFGIVEISMRGIDWPHNSGTT